MAASCTVALRLPALALDRWLFIYFYVGRLHKKARNYIFGLHASLKENVLK
jgi:hypothetical protein